MKVKLNVPNLGRDAFVIGSLVFLLILGGISAFFPLIRYLAIFSVLTLFASMGMFAIIALFGAAAIDEPEKDKNEII